MVSHVLRRAVAATAVVVGVGHGRDAHGFDHRYAIVDGADFVIVGRAMFASYEHTHSCLRVEVKRYAKERVIVRLCYV